MLLFHIGVTLSNPRLPHLISPPLHLNGGNIKANVLEAFYGGNIKANVLEAFYCSFVRETIDSLGVGNNSFMFLKAIYGI